MIWQYDHRVDRERMTFASLTKRRAEDFNVFRQQSQPPVGKIDRKEKQPPGMKLRRYAVITCSHDELMGFASLYPSYETKNATRNWAAF